MPGGQRVVGIFTIQRGVTPIGNIASDQKERADISSARSEITWKTWDYSAPASAKSDFAESFSAAADGAGAGATSACVRASAASIFARISSARCSLPGGVDGAIEERLTLGVGGEQRAMSVFRADFDSSGLVGKHRMSPGSGFRPALLKIARRLRRCRLRRFLYLRGRTMKPPLRRPLEIVTAILRTGARFPAASPHDRSVADDPHRVVRGLSNQNSFAPRHRDRIHGARIRRVQSRFRQSLRDQIPGVRSRDVPAVPSEAFVTEAMMPETMMLAAVSGKTFAPKTMMMMAFPAESG